MLEIDQQENFKATRLQIVDALRRMNIAQGINTFQLDQNPLFNHQIRNKVTHLFAFVVNRQAYLLFYNHPSAIQLH